VNWGTWDALGDLSEELRRRYVRGGLLPMPAVQALDLLGRLLGAPDAVQLTVAQIDWTALKSVYEARRRRPLLEHVSDRQAAPSRATTPDAPLDVMAVLGLLPTADRQAGLTELVRVEAASVLGVRPDEIDPQHGLFEMGMDSLMSVELRARLERAVGRRLPATLTFNYPNVRALVLYLDGLIASAPVTPAATPAATPASRSAAAPPTATLDDLSDDLSEDEIAAMLSDAIQSLN
jgi:acyl carrier protein